ncbi:50S ribosomal protein L15 [candidate division WWE3 bacterium]|uniref:Large ribosomal subunit protein uL15 n=1 Tax=candidate division WWE3 bacterium TaxID=2053526 RepID=A0A7X9HSL1_UNCKA|nr:50S ribosomal protein L15 [candidate division WWE3 bacterium]
MELSKLTKYKTEKKSKRVGRGRGSGKGGHTVGKGTKGQKARRGTKFGLGFEGGQSPLYKRLPQIGGFRRHLSKEIQVVNLNTFNSFKDGEVVTPEVLLEKKIIKNVSSDGVKILSGGDLKKKLTLKNFLFSKEAKEKIEKSGSKINV